MVQLESNEQDESFSIFGFLKNKLWPSQDSTQQNLSSNSPTFVHQENYTENGVEYDRHGNILSEAYDLGKDGSFNDFSLLIGKFINRGPMNDSFVGLAVKALQKKGFRVDDTSDENTFTEKLNSGNYDVAWIVSGDKFQGNQKDFKEAVINFHRKGRGLLIYGDNLPLYVQANILLPELVGCELYGDTAAGNTLQYGKAEIRGFFDENHPVFTGINNLYEGVTICYPNRPSKLVTLATSTDGNPCILKCEAKESNIADGGRILVDSGWTKLYSSYWASAGQARYVVNATVWLIDLEGRFGTNESAFK